MIAMMPCRIDWLRAVVDGFFKTGAPLVAYDGTSLQSFAGLDDIGLYIVIPKLMYYFNISFESAVTGFLYALVICGAAFGFLGCALLFHSLFAKIVAAGSIVALSCLVVHIGDVYVTYFASICTVVPLFIFLHQRNNFKELIYFLFGAGFFLGFVHYVRAYSSIGVFLFIMFVLMFHQNKWIKKIQFCAALIIGLSLPVFFFAQQKKQFKQFAHAHGLDIQVSYHPFWHSVYLGFGLLQFLNKDHIAWDDQCGIDKGKNAIPSVKYGTPAYEQFLKNEVTRLIIHQPLFVLFTLFAKIGILLLFLLCAAHIGLLGHFFAPSSFGIELGFLLLFGWYAIFPLIAMPYFSYALGFISVAVLYGIIGINNCIERFANMTIVKRVWYGS